MDHLKQESQNGVVKFGSNPSNPVGKLVKVILKKGPNGQRNSQPVQLKMIKISDFKTLKNVNLKNFTPIAAKTKFAPRLVQSSKSIINRRHSSPSICSERDVLSMKPVQIPQKRLITRSTQTEVKNLVEIQTQTETSLLDTLSNIEYSYEPVDNSTNTMEFISVKDVNMGVGPKIDPCEIRNNMTDIGGGTIISYPTDTEIEGQQLHLSADVLLLSKQYCIKNLKEKFNACLEPNQRGNFPIHEAVIANNIVEVQRQCIVLTLKKVSVDITNERDHTPLQLATIEDCNPTIASYLINYGANIAILDQEGNNIIHLAVTESSEEYLEMLLNHTSAHNSYKDLADAHNFEGYTPLIMCIQLRKYDHADCLLRNGVDPNRSDSKSGRTPLFHAVENNDLKMVVLLFNYNADKTKKNFVGTSAHEAVFEIDSLDSEIKSIFVNRKVNNKERQVKFRKRLSKYVRYHEVNKKQKLETVAVRMPINLEEAKSPKTYSKVSSSSK